MPDDNKIDRALKRIREARDVRVGIRNGRVAIIYKQEIRASLQDGVQQIHSIPEDITDE